MNVYEYYFVLKTMKTEADKFDLRLKMVTYARLLFYAAYVIRFCLCDCRPMQFGFKHFKIHFPGLQ